MVVNITVYKSNNRCTHVVCAENFIKYIIYIFLPTKVNLYEINYKLTVHIYKMFDDTKISVPSYMISIKLFLISETTELGIEKMTSVKDLIQGSKWKAVYHN